PPDRGRRVPLRGPLRRHVQVRRGVGLAHRRGGGAGGARRGPRMRGHAARGRRAAPAPGARGAQAGPVRFAGAGGGAPPARAFALRRLHGAEGDPLPRRAAQDRDGKDPALPAPGREVKVDGAELHVEDTGGSGPAIAFSHGLLWSTTMWRFQIAAFRDAYRCIAWDHRGQGKSEVTASGYDMDTLAQDA